MGNRISKGSLSVRLINSNTLQFIFLLKNSKKCTNVYFHDYSASRGTKSTSGKCPRKKTKGASSRRTGKILPDRPLKYYVDEESMFKKKRKNYARPRMQSAKCHK